MIDIAFIEQWACLYSCEYDDHFYYPYLRAARQGDHVALRRLTEWKNSAKDGRPVPLSAPQEKAFQFFLSRLQNYFGDKGKSSLRADFSSRAPVWATFWHHILFGTPIFDVYTHMAWHWDVTGVRLLKSEAKLFAPGHWPTYDRYTFWLNTTLAVLRSHDARITERQVDRALVMWGANP